MKGVSGRGVSRGRVREEVERRSAFFVRTWTSLAAEAIIWTSSVLLQPKKSFKTHVCLPSNHGAGTVVMKN
jgi:hypothetical protein